MHLWFAMVTTHGSIISHPFFDPKFIDYSRAAWGELQSKIMERELIGKWERPDHSVTITLLE